MTVSNQDVKKKSFIHKIFTSKEKEGSGSLDFSALEVFAQIGAQKRQILWNKWSQRSRLHCAVAAQDAVGLGLPLEDDVFLIVGHFRDSSERRIRLPSSDDCVWQREFRKSGRSKKDLPGECKQCKTRSEKWTKASISTCCCNTQQMKIVVKVPMHCDKCRTKALKIAAAAHGVSKVSIDKDLVEVIGDDVDPFCLMKSLRKRFGCCCALVKVEEVKPPPRPPRPPPPPPPASCVQNCCTCTPHCRSMYCVQYCCTPQFRPMYCELVHEYPEPPTCSIM